MTRAGELHHASILETVADVMGDADAVVQGDRRVTWAELDERASRFAGVLAEAGLGHGDKVALYLHNDPAYVEAWYGSLKQRAIPVNVNYRYLDDELRYLIDNSDAVVVVHHSSLAERIDAVRDRLPAVRRWIEVDDGGPGSHRSTPYEAALAAADPAPRIPRDGDDLNITYTGGTTGSPKGVMSRLSGGVLSATAGISAVLGLEPHDPLDTAEQAAALLAAGRQPVSVVPCPLMHGTGMGIGVIPSLLYGGRIVLTDPRHFDPVEVWEAIRREQAGMLTVVGDVMARPLADALDDGRVAPDGLPLAVIASAGAMFSAEVKDRLCAAIPGLAVLDIMASTEVGMGQSIHAAGARVETGSFVPNPNVVVLDEDLRPVEPGSGVVGMVAVRGSVPVGYYKDPEKTARTFPVIDGEPHALTGDHALLHADGSITLLGRGSQVINTGGEKVFAEEVEEAVKRHPDVTDCLVAGVPDERFGSLVGAVVSTSSPVDAEQLRSFLRTSLAGYKVPRRITFVDRVPRAPNGKADYPTARDLLGS